MHTKICLLYSLSAPTLLLPLFFFINKNYSCLLFILWVDFSGTFHQRILFHMELILEANVQNLLGLFELNEIPSTLSRKLPYQSVMCDLYCFISTFFLYFFLDFHSYDSQICSHRQPNNSLDLGVMTNILSPETKYLKKNQLGRKMYYLHHKNHA